MPVGKAVASHTAVTCSVSLSITLDNGQDRSPMSVWAVVTKNHRLLRVSEAGKFKIKILADLVSGEGLVHRWPSSMCPHMTEEGREPLWGLFYKDTNPIYEGSVLMT